MLWTVYALISALAIVLGVGGLCGGWLSRRYIRRRLALPPGDYAPRAVVLLPCKGIDDNLADTIRALDQQDYPEYRVICAFESADDPACDFVKHLITELGTDKFDTVISCPATARAQKIENLVAGIGKAGDWPEVYAFCDSDAVPYRGWLRYLVGALAEDGVGASTGYRWYAPDEALVNVVRCQWDAVPLTFLGQHRYNFCWGGSMAVRRELFEQFGMRERWARALSEDYHMGRAAYDANMTVRFVPQCVIPCHSEGSWREFLTFARRQLIIARVCEPWLWLAIAAVSMTYLIGYWMPAALLLWGLASARWELVVAGAVVLGPLYLLSTARTLLRRATVSSMLRGRARPGPALPLDVLGPALLGIVNTLLVIASGLSRRFRWRGTRYEMRSRLETAVLSRDSHQNRSASPEDAGSGPEDARRRPASDERADIEAAREGPL